MGGFVQGLGQGYRDSQAAQAEIDSRRQQAELFKLKSKQLTLETDMTERQLKAQADLPNMLFKAPQQRQVTVQGPGAPQEPADKAGLLAGYSPSELAQAGGEQGVLNQYATEGPQPTGMADIPGTGGPWGNMSPELQNIAKSILVSTGGDMPKTMQTLQMLAPGVFPKQPIQTKLNQGEVLSEYDPNTKTSRTLAAGMPKEHNPTVVPPESTVLDPVTHKPIYQAPPKADKQADLKKRIVEVGGVAYEAQDGEGGKIVLTKLQGQEEKEAKSPVNPVDQYIFAQSGGQYHNMAEAAAAGQTDLIKQAEQVVREQRPLDRAEAMAGVMTREAAVRERTAQTIKQEQPLEQKERSNLFDRKALLAGKLVRPAPGTSKGEASRADLVEVNDKQLEQLKMLDKASADMDSMFNLVDPLITAKDWKTAKFKQAIQLHGGAASGFIPAAATYQKAKAAATSNMAKTFGGETGVMTDTDITRWTNTMVEFGDTVAVKDAKRKLSMEIRDHAIQAQRRVLAGDDIDSVRTDLQQKIQPLLQKGDKIGGKQQAPPVPDHLKHLPKEMQDSWQQTYMEQMEGMLSQ